VLESIFLYSLIQGIYETLPPFNLSFPLITFSLFLFSFVFFVFVGLVVISYNDFGVNIIFYETMLPGYTKLSISYLSKSLISIHIPGYIAYPLNSISNHAHQFHVLNSLPLTNYCLLIISKLIISIMIKFRIF
jgi:hypothetical protein